MIRNSGIIGRAVRGAAVVAVALTSLGFAAATAASAAPATPGTGTAKQVRATMTLNCAALAPDKRQFAVDHQYCPPVTAAEKSGGVGAQNIVPGTCGTSWLWIWDRGQGVAEFDFGAHSTQGSITEVSWNIPWYNYRTGVANAFGDASWPWSSQWDDSVRIWTDTGRVSATLTGTAILWWGATCDIQLPSDYQDIH
jgi:hypothetical protein